MFTPRFPLPDRCAVFGKIFFKKALHCVPLLKRCHTAKKSSMLSSGEGVAGKPVYPIQSSIATFRQCLFYRNRTRDDNGLGLEHIYENMGRIPESSKRKPAVGNPAVIRYLYNRFVRNSLKGCVRASAFCDGCGKIAVPIPVSTGDETRESIF